MDATIGVEGVMDHRESDELSYWRSQLMEYKRTGGAWYDGLLDPDSPLDGEIERHIKASGAAGLSRLSVLDLGCGPLSVLGKRGSNFGVEIVGIDPMADAYAAVLQEVGVTPPFTLRRGFGENLDEMFEPSTFDFVHSRNALDHCQDAPKVIKNMVDLAKDDTRILITVFQNEGEKAGYSGFHTWNFDEFNERITVWTPQVAHFLENLTGGHPYTYTKKHIGQDPKHPHEFTICIQKVHRDLSKYQEVAPGVFALMSRESGWLVLHAVGQLDPQYDVFMHVYDDAGNATPITFRWYPDSPIRAFRLPIQSPAYVSIGQFEPQYASNAEFESYRNLWVSEVRPNYPY